MPRGRCGRALGGRLSHRNHLGLRCGRYGRRAPCGTALLGDGRLCRGPLVPGLTPRALCHRLAVRTGLGLGLLLRLGSLAEAAGVRLLLGSLHARVCRWSRVGPVYCACTHACDTCGMCGQRRLGFASPAAHPIPCFLPMELAAPPRPGAAPALVLWQALPRSPPGTRRWAHPPLLRPARPPTRRPWRHSRPLRLPLLPPPARRPAPRATSAGTAGSPCRTLASHTPRVTCLCCTRVHVWVSACTPAHLLLIRGIGVLQRSVKGVLPVGIVVHGRNVLLRLRHIVLVKARAGHLCCWSGREWGWLPSESAGRC